MRRVGVDTGGTFTDFLVVEEGETSVHKAPSTPDDPARSILSVVQGWEQRDRTELVHGSTVATNALLERRGARIGWVTTRGFGDVIEIGRQDRPQIYSLSWQAPRPVVESESRFEVSERVGAGGEVITPLEENAVRELLPALRELDVEAIAVGFLFSPENASHERAAAKILRELGVPVVESAAVHPELREYERFSTATLSAYVAPVMDRYLARLERELQVQRFRIMESSGGVMAWDRLRDQAVRTVLSGPAGGVVAAKHLAEETSNDSLVTFDMGGTSTDVSLVVSGDLSRTHNFRIDGLPVAVPVVDVETVGAGGGSLLWVDAGGALRVGPQSAGADPGPICYGRGGRQPTVTDVNLLLGRLPRTTRLGGHLRLDHESAEEPFRELAAELGVSVLRLAHGALQVVEAEMERALRRITQERGVDPRDLTLVPFGGAGGLHAVALARALGMSRVLVPPDPGILSAAGMLLAPEVEHVSASVGGVLSDSALSELRQRCRALEEAPREYLVAGGHPEGSLRVHRELAMRFVGQSHTLDVTWEESAGATRVRDDFLDRYRQRYGFVDPDQEIEVTSLKSQVLAGGLSALPRRARPSESKVAPRQTPVYLDGDESTTLVPLVSREALREPISGPAVIEETSSTFWLPPGAKIEVNDNGCLAVGTGV